ncbi:tripartite tricarboxylate transporter substrate binding protein, partial [bacterium]
MLLSLTAVATLIPGITSAQSPSEPIRLVVGFAPGGPTDAVARLAAEVLTAKLGNPAFVDNRPGASGAIAASAVSNAKPDGHTLLVNVVA